MGEHASLLERLARTARVRAFPDDAATLEGLLRYLEAVIEANQRTNLTAARDLAAAVDVLALSALAVTCAVERAPRTVVDLGTGNGFPGVAAALAWPQARVRLVERRGRKAEAVRACADAAGLANVEVVTCDGREVARERPDVVGATDLVTVRAVGTLEEAARIAAPWLAPGGRLAHWKGRGLAKAERRAGEKAARATGLVPLPVRAFDDDAGPGHLVIYERPAAPGGSA